MEEYFPKNRRRRTPKIEIIPMVDVMFLLLVFYILSSLALSTQNGISVNLPEAKSGQQNQVEEIVITIDKDGQFFLGKEKVDPAKLAVALEKKADEAPGGLKRLREGNVVLNADLKVTHDKVVLAMDQLRTLGISNFAIATEAP